MAWKWLSKLAEKIASEVLKTQIDDLEKRILSLEQERKVVSKAISDIEKRLEKLDDRVYNLSNSSAFAAGINSTLLQSTTIDSSKLLNQGGDGNNFPRQ